MSTDTPTPSQPAASPTQPPEPAPPLCPPWQPMFDRYGTSQSVVYLCFGDVRFMRLQLEHPDPQATWTAAEQLGITVVLERVREGLSELAGPAREAALEWGRLRAQLAHFERERQELDTLEMELELAHRRAVADRSLSPDALTEALAKVREGQRRLEERRQYLVPAEQALRTQEPAAREATIHEAERHINAIRDEVSAELRARRDEFVARLAASPDMTAALLLTAALDLSVLNPIAQSERDRLLAQAADVLALAEPPPPRPAAQAA